MVFPALAAWIGVGVTYRKSWKESRSPCYHCMILLQYLLLQLNFSLGKVYTHTHTHITIINSWLNMFVTKEFSLSQIYYIKFAHYITFVFAHQRMAGCSVPWHNSYCWPLLDCVHGDRHIPPTSHWPEESQHTNLYKSFMQPMHIISIFRWIHNLTHRPWERITRLLESLITSVNNAVEHLHSWWPRGLWV